MPVLWNCSAHDVQESKCIKDHLVYKVTLSGHLWLLHEVFFACTNPFVSWHPPKNLSAGTSHGFCSCPSICDLSTTTKWTRTSCECINFAVMMASQRQLCPQKLPEKQTEHNICERHFLWRPNWAHVLYSKLPTHMCMLCLFYARRQCCSWALSAVLWVLAQAQYTTIRTATPTFCVYICF